MLKGNKKKVIIFNKKKFKRKKLKPSKKNQMYTFSIDTISIFFPSFICKLVLYFETGHSNKKPRYVTPAYISFNSLK